MGFQQHALLPWLTAYDNVLLAVEEVIIAVFDIASSEAVEKGMARTLGEKRVLAFEKAWLRHRDLLLPHRRHCCP